MRHRQLKGTVVTAALLATLGAPAHADVTIVEAMSMDGTGMMSMAGMSGTTTTIIAGQNGRIESDVKMKSSMMRMFAGGLTAEITRIADDKVYELNLKKKQYSETSLSARRAQIEKAMADSEQARAQQQQGASPVDQADCEWSPPKSELKKTGEKATIAGHAAERSTLTVTQTCTNRKTGDVCDFGLALDQWFAPKLDVSGEQQAYYKAYAERMGFGNPGSRDFAQNAQQMFGSYKTLWAEVAKKAATLKGYPVRSSFALAIGGPQCKSMQAAAQPGMNGTPGAAEAMAVAGQLGSALGGMFGKKPAAQSAATAAAAPALLVNGMTPMMTISSELISISTASVGAELFAPPADFKKVAAP